MKLFMSGQKFKTPKEPPRVIKVKAFLNNSKDGELFSSGQVAQATNLCVNIFRSENFYVEGYFHVHKQKKYWGKPKTIKALIKETAKS